MKKISENRVSTDQKQPTPAAKRRRRNVLRLLRRRTFDFRASGHLHESWRTVNGCRLGPYFSLRFVRAGRETSVYLGADQQLAQAVRERLSQLQQPRRDALAYRQRWREQRAVLRGLRAELAREIAPCGLRVQGAEIRGWRRLKLLRAVGAS